MDSTELESLVGMGFEKTRAEIALKKGGNLQNAIDWLEANQERTLEDIQSATGGDGGGTNGATDSADANARSFVCNECGKKFRGLAEAEYHGGKSGHTDFAESTEEIVPLTEEEKKQRLEELRERLKAKRAGQSEQDKSDQKRNEEIRRKGTREAQDIKEDLQKKEQIKEAARKRQEKQDDIMAKQRIREKIAADKEERRLKAEREKAERAGVAVSPADVSPAQATAPQANKPASAYTYSRLRLQTPSTTLTKSFAVDTTLAEVAEAIAQEVSGFRPSSFIQNFPKRIYEGVDFGATLKELSLSPSASLIVK